jgi:dual specificity tyrosine-phosphorylation-regulated kinase 1
VQESFAAAPSDAPQACDDEHGNYKVVVGEVWDGRYEVLQLLGKGSFGQVVKVLDRSLNEQVAIKIIKNKKSFFNQAQIEVRLLEHIKAADVPERGFVVEYRRQFVFSNHLCLEFELLSFNLYELLKNTGFQGVSLNLVRKFGQQLLSALAFLGSPAIDIIHCDLKPENILLRNPKRSAIKVIDFGSSCHTSQRMYTYIQSRFYRAPEVVLDRGYGTPIDMWSLGAILVEMHTGEPLFPGRTEADLLFHMVEVLDMPTDLYIETSGAKFHKFFTLRAFEPNGPKYRMRTTRSVQGAAFARRPLTIALAAPRRRRSAEAGHSAADYARFTDLVTRMLTYDPAERITPLEALHHPFLNAPDDGGGAP